MSLCDILVLVISVVAIVIAVVSVWNIQQTRCMGKPKDGLYTVPTLDATLIGGYQPHRPEGASPSRPPKGGSGVLPDPLRPPAPPAPPPRQREYQPEFCRHRGRALG